MQNLKRFQKDSKKILGIFSQDINTEGNLSNLIYISGQVILETAPRLAKQMEKQEQEHGSSPITTLTSHGLSYLSSLLSDESSNWWVNENAGNLALSTTRDLFNLNTKFRSRLSRLSIIPFTGRNAKTLKGLSNTLPRMTLVLTDLGQWVGTYQNQSGLSSWAILEPGSSGVGIGWREKTIIEKLSGSMKEKEMSEKQPSLNTAQSIEIPSSSEEEEQTSNTESQDTYGLTPGYHWSSFTSPEASKTSCPTRPSKRSRTESFIQPNTKVKWSSLTPQRLFASPTLDLN